MLIDTHAHLEMREFNDDRDDVIKRAKDAGVEYIVTIGTTVESSRDAVLLAEKYDFIILSEVTPSDLPEYSSLRVWVEFL